MLEDEDEDFRALFFIECDENLADLQERLDALLAGDRDAETVDAAFRAVHSVKGGAAAFGFSGLVSFAHELETVMDRVRSGLLALTPDICETLLRAGDVMSALVEAARTDAAAPDPADAAGPAERVAHVAAQLAVLLPADAAASPPDPLPAPESVATKPDGIPAGEGTARGMGPIAARVRLAPGPAFLLSGFDPLRIIRAARAQGLTSASVEGSVPPIGDYRPGSCPLAWRLEFEVDGMIEGLRAFLAPYAYCAEVTLEWPGGYETVSPEVGWIDADGAVALATEPRSSSPAMPSRPPAEEAAPRPPTEARAEDAAVDAPADLLALPDATADPLEEPAAQAAPAKAGARPETGPRGTTATRARSLRVALDRIDRLVNLVGEVLIAQAAVAQGLDEAGTPDRATLKPLIESLDRQTRELQESVMAIRAQPVRNVFARLPRIVRDLCDALGKEARLVIQGEEVEVDTTVIEEVNEPLVHMIRNAMDHGLEGPAERERRGKPRQGTLTLTAEQRGDRVRITLADDGRGIDRERILATARSRGLVGPEEQLDAAAIEALIFHPGFSTAQEISSVSGRGVGMDVVRRKIQALGGRCVVASEPGAGTTFTITLPLTLAVMDGMAVRVEEQQFILPLSNVVEALTVEPGRVNQLPDRSRVIKLRDAYLPVYSLRSALALPDRPDLAAPALVIDTETSGQVVVMVDDLLGQRQVVLKSLETNVGHVRGVGGATILGDGRVALVLDVPALLRLGPRGAQELERVH